MDWKRAASSGTSVILIFLLNLTALALLSSCQKTQTDTPLVGGEPSALEQEMSDGNQQRFVLDRATKDKIDSWLEENDLNRYGDPKGTMYTGGTPLFDMKTGKRIDRYKYILEKYPELLESLQR